MRTGYVPNGETRVVQARDVPWSEWSSLLTALEMEFNPMNNGCLHWTRLTYRIIKVRQEYYQFHPSACPNSYTVWDLQELLHEARGRKEGLLMWLEIKKYTRNSKQNKKQIKTEHDKITTYKSSAITQYWRPHDSHHWGQGSEGMTCVMYNVNSKTRSGSKKTLWGMSEISEQNEI